MEAARQRDEIGPNGGFPPAEVSDSEVKILSSAGKPQTNFFRRPPQAVPKPETRPEIAEFIIFSSQGDLIYQWQCGDVAGRVGFLEFISQKARQLSQGLPLGQFEGFEIYGSKSRVIAQMEGDHAVFVRTDLLPVDDGRPARPPASYYYNKLGMVSKPS